MTGYQVVQKWDSLIISLLFQSECTESEQVKDICHVDMPTQPTIIINCGRPGEQNP